jgi:hypothetical protein
MKLRFIVCAGILSLIAVSWVKAQQGVSSIPATGVPVATSGSAHDPSNQPVAPQPTVQPWQAEVYRPQMAPGEAAAEDPGVPHYPYPPYPNPFYEESPRRKPLADGVEWLWGLPSNVVERFSTFIDTRLFPNKPATHGGGVPAHPPVARPTQAIPRPFVPQAPLPSALPAAR